MAIKKGFDSIIKSDDEDEKYTTKDIQKVYHHVIDCIEKEYVDANEEKIKIETIQDMIEASLKKYHYDHYLVPVRGRDNASVVLFSKL